jgi:hypothetical protein
MLLNNREWTYNSKGRDDFAGMTRLAKDWRLPSMPNRRVQVLAADTWVEIPECSRGRVEKLRAWW